MKKLIALLAAVGAIVFFWRKKHEEEAPSWGAASDSGGSWGDTAAGEAKEAAETVSEAAADADE